MKLKITLGILILTSSLLLIGLFYSIPQFIDVERQSLIENENIILSGVRESARVALLTRQFSDLQDIASNVLSYARVEDIQITDQDYIVVASNAADLLGSINSDFAINSAWIWRHQSIENASGLVGQISIRFSYQHFNQSVKTLWITSLLSAFFGIAIIAFISWLYASKLTQKLESLVNAAKVLADGDFDVAVSTSGNDEMASLGRSFAQMAGRIKQSFHTLKASEQRYALAAAGTNDGIWEWDLESGQVYFSPRWKSILGYKAEESWESSSYWYDRVAREDVNTLKAAFQVHIDGDSDHVEIEFRMLNHGNNIIWISCRGLVQRNDVGKAINMAGSISDITNRKNTENVLQQQAMYDGLTGLPNRHLFIDRLNRSFARIKRDSNKKIAVMFIDLDRFKTINDSLGHAAGDRLLVEISKRFVHIIRETDTLARFGGDEFILLLDSVDDISLPVTIAERLCSEAKKGLDISGHTVYVSASIGLVYATATSHNSESILRDADVAMYKTKAKGGDGYTLFDRAMHVDAVSQLQIATDLQAAVQNDEFRVFYQPILDVATQKWSGFEALIRWQHPTRGLISPLEFIPLAEQNGMINEIGEWVLMEATRQLSIWSKQSPEQKKWNMSINISVRQIDNTLTRKVLSAVKSNGLSPSQVQIEITESLVMNNMKHAINIANELKASGISLAMDDFGTGYSSLSYLHRLPFSVLKIDRSFINVMDTKNILEGDMISAIIRLAKNFHMKVIAEGVEKEEQFLALQSLGCQYVQGYLIAKPMPAEKIDVLIAEGKSGFQPGFADNDGVVSIF